MLKKILWHRPAVCVLFYIFWVFWNPIFVKAETSAPSTENMKVSVSIFQSLDHQYLVEPLTLACPMETTAAGLLDMLVRYAYLQDYSLDANGSISTITDGDGVMIGGEEGEWLMSKNGTSLTGMLENEVLAEGDALEVLFSADISPITPQATASAQTKEVASMQIAASWENEHNTVLIKACSWLQTKGKTKDTVIALGTAGVTIEHKALSTILKLIYENKPENGLDLSKSILAVTFCGVSAENVTGKNLINELREFPDISRTESIWALIAADCNEYPLTEGSVNNRDSLLNVIMAAQNKDGGFAAVRDELSDPLVTALALTAMSSYTTEPTVRNSVDAGLQYLSLIQQADGSFLEDGEISPRTIAAVLTAFNSLGILPDDPRFAERQGGLFSLLLTYQTESGGFATSIAGEPDAETTFYAITSMISLKSGRNPYVLRTQLTGTGSPNMQSSEAVSEPASKPTIEQEPEPTGKVPYVLYGLGVGVLIGLVILLAMVRFMRKATEKLDKSDK